MTATAALPMPDPGALPLRGYQRAAIAAIDEAAARGVTRQLLVLPTGSGKTVIFAHLAAASRKRVLILVHRDELARQTVAKLLQVDPGADVGVVKAARDEHDAHVVVASVQTLSRPARLARIVKDFGLVIVDEAHHATAATYLDVLAAVGSMDPGGPVTLGFTATAGRADGDALGRAWEEITYQRGILQMIAEGYLCDVRALAVTADVDLGNVRQAHGDYTDGALGEALEAAHALEAAAIAYRRHAGDRKGVAFAPTVATSTELARLLSDQGIPAEHLDGTTHPDDRRAILARLASGKTQVVTNCMVLTEGWDEPSVSCMLNCRPTQNRGLFIQMAGRVLRTHPGKADALILDVGGAASLGLATVADLAGLPGGSVGDGETLRAAAGRILAEQENQAAVAALRAQEIELFRRSDLRWLEAGSTWVLPAGSDVTMALVPAGESAWNVYRLPRHGVPVLDSGRPMPMEWARGVAEEIARANGGVLSAADARWRTRPATPQQAQFLDRIGHGAPQNRGDAADLITVYMTRKSLRKIGVR